MPINKLLQEQMQNFNPVGRRLPTKRKHKTMPRKVTLTLNDSDQTPINVRINSESDEEFNQISDNTNHKKFYLTF